MTRRWTAVLCLALGLVMTDRLGEALRRGEGPSSLPTGWA